MIRKAASVLAFIIVTAFAGNLTAQTSPDVLNRLLSKIIPNSTEMSSGFFLNDSVHQYRKISGIWTLDKVFSKGYDSQGVLQELISYTIGSNGTMNPEYKWEFSYNANSELIQALKSRKQGSSWVGKEMTEYAYNASGRLSEELLKEFSNNTWTGILKKEYSYDTQGRIIVESFLTISNGNWEFDNQLVFSYSVGINRREALHRNWTGNGWEDSLKTVTTFDWSDNLLDEYVYEWDGTNWENEYMVFFSHDANDLLVERVAYKWNGSSWKNHTRDIHTYDQHLLLSSSEHQTWVSQAWSGKDKLEYSYINPNATGIASHDPGIEISVYPNPVTAHAIVHSDNDALFQSASVSLFDQSGRLLRNEVLKFDADQYTFYRENLPAGIYILSIVSDKGIKTNQRLILQ